jgi:hypothetical protein
MKLMALTASQRHKKYLKVRQSVSLQIVASRQTAELWRVYVAHSGLKAGAYLAHLLASNDHFLR